MYEMQLLDIHSYYANANTQILQKQLSKFTIHLPTMD